MTPPTPRVDHPADLEATLAPGSSPTDSYATLAPSDTPPAPDGRAPAGYAIERELGRGGMGVVYLARHLALDRPCALKMILSGVHADGDEIARLRTEAQAIARLQHPGIVQVFEIGEHDGRPFVALEFCPGGSLDVKLAKKPLAPRDAAVLVEKLAGAVHAAHEAQVIHRDLKPGNVLLTATGEPKITDFGLAKKLDEQGATRTGSVMGTPSYMPPEQAEGKRDIGPAADVYALGAILYECLASRPPFRAATAMETLLQVLTEEPVPVRQLNPAAPVDLETIAHKCLQKDPQRRYATAQELADDLGRYLRGEPIRARRVGATERALKLVRRHLLVSALAVAAMLALVGGVAVSSFFAFEANRRAEAEAKAKDDADREARAARKAEGQAIGLANAEAIAKDVALREKARADEQLTRKEWLAYARNLSLAQSTFQDGDGALALQYLDECQWNLRGWEHHHLWTRFNSKQTLRVSGNVYSVAWSPDGNHILTGSWPGVANVWDSENGRDRVSLKGHTGPVRGVAFSPDGRRVLTGSEDETARVWDARAGQELLTLKGHAGAVTGVAFSPDGRRVLTGSADKTAKVWDAETGRDLLTLKKHTKSLAGVAWSPDGKRIITGSEDGTARVWDAQSGQELLTLMGRNRVNSVAFSPDGRRVLTGSEDKTARVWDARAGQELLTLKGHAGAVTGVAFSPDGRRVLTGSADKTAKVWDAERVQAVFTLKGHTGKVNSVTWSPDGRRVLTGSADKTAKVWDAETGQEPLEIRGQSIPVTTMAESPDHTCILTGNTDGRAEVFDMMKGSEALTLMGHTGPVRGVAWSPDGRRVLTGSEDETARVWDARAGQELLTLKGHAGAVTGVAFSPDGRRVLTGSADKTAKVWDAERVQAVFTLKGHEQEVTHLAFSADGKRLFAWAGRPVGERLRKELPWISINANVLAWSTKTGQPTEAVDPPAIPPDGYASARSPDGFLTAEGKGTFIEVTDSRLVDRLANQWYLPHAAERKRYHGEQAALAEKEKHHFAAAFHLGRLLLDAPDDADLKRRREQALKNHADAAKDKGK